MGRFNNPLSVSENREYGGLIYESEIGIYATDAVKGDHCTAVDCSVDTWNAMVFVPEGATVIADYHTHGAYQKSEWPFPESSNDYFSQVDVIAINRDANIHPGYLGGYLGTPGGGVYYYAAGVMNEWSYTIEKIKDMQRYVGNTSN